jgi:starvation-inducible DNA-binding protein
METGIGISQENRQSVASELSKLLADEFVLYAKTRGAHWNIEGNNFYALHLLFERQYEQLDEMIDDVAERIRSIGHFTPATLKNYLAIAHLSEASRSTNDGAGFVRELLIDHEQIIMHIRENINRFSNNFLDIGSSDFITGLMEQHEKMAWMLRAHLKH